MKNFRPDIVVTSPEGEYWMVIEVKPSDVGTHVQNTIEHLKRIMTSSNCSIGFAVTGDRIVLLRDSFEQSEGQSIYTVGEASLPDSLLSSVREQSNGKFISESEFSLRVQQWFEKLKMSSTVQDLSIDLKKLFGEPIISLIRLGEIRAAYPRWSGVAK
jgi:hypothetical protein